MTPNAFFLQLALFSFGNFAVKAFVHKRESLNTDFVFPDQLEFVSRPSSLDLRRASVGDYQRTFMDWDVDDGHQYQTQFTLRRAKPFGESKPRKPLTSAVQSGMNNQNEILFAQEGSSNSSDQSANLLTSQASGHSTPPSSLATSNTAFSQSPAYTQSFQYSNQNLSGLNTSRSNFGNDKQVIQLVQTTNDTNLNIGYFPPSKSAKNTGDGRQLTLPIVTITSAVSASQITLTNTASQNANNSRGGNRPSGSHAHSSSVVTAVGVGHSKPVLVDSSHEPDLPTAPRRPYESQSSSSRSGSGLYFGTSETYAFRSNFEGGDDSGNEFLLSFQDLVKHPLLHKLYNSDLYNARYRTLVNFQQSSSSGSSQRMSSGSSSSGSSFPKDFPAFSSSSLGFEGGISSSSIGKDYFFQS